MRSKISYMICFLCMLYSGVQAQVVYFQYDETGNRVRRWVIDELKSSDSITSTPLPVVFLYATVESRIYPNPTTDFLNVEIRSELNDWDLYIYDHAGRELKKESINNSAVIDLSSYNTGLYYILICNDKNKSVYKIIKQ